MVNYLRIAFTVGCLVLIILTCLSAQKTEEKISTSEVVLIEEDFVKNNCENVGDALQTITGVYVNSTGAISLRDVSSSKVVVVLDGQRLNTAQGGGVNVSDMTIDNIEKIELLRGGRSAQYGADAVGGVIRITTKSQQTGSKIVSLGVKTTFGSYNKQIYN
ncbi:MAG: TonB-dependent receptor plug domain-containing protein, partial [Planctomycetia bacterium]|nr:TonB-dependent receptor plug domain-containing protein [Planctomycetia bacterium]